MSREAVDRIVGLARKSYESGKLKPRMFRFVGDECCILGAAAGETLVDRSASSPLTFARESGLSDDEAWGLISGWDGCPKDSAEDEYAYGLAVALSREFIPTNY